MEFFLGVLVGYVGVMLTMLFIFALASASSKAERAAEKARSKRSPSQDIDHQWVYRKEK